MTERQPRTTKVKELVLKAKKKIDPPYSTREALILGAAAGLVAVAAVVAVDTVKGYVPGENQLKNPHGVEKVVFPGIK